MVVDDRLMRGDFVEQALCGLVGEQEVVVEIRHLELFSCWLSGALLFNDPFLPGNLKTEKR